MDQLAERSLRIFARAVASRQLDVHVQGLAHLPADGPVVIAARHYHHLHDAVALLAMIPRPVQILVALDWVQHQRGRRIMEWACRTARWPFVLRADSPHLRGVHAASAYRPEESFRVTRQATHDVAALLQAGCVLLIFPEAYPVIDPEGSQRPHSQEVQPFRPGFAKLVAHAQRAIGTPVPVVPAGFSYRPGERWQVTLRLGPPAFFHSGTDLSAFVREIEAQVRALSGVALDATNRPPQTPVR